MASVESVSKVNDFIPFALSIISNPPVADKSGLHLDEPD
jgi:hypothetical protein